MNFEYLYFLLDAFRLNEMRKEELVELKRWIENNDSINQGVKDCDIWIIDEELETR